MTAYLRQPLRQRGVLLKGAGAAVELFWGLVRGPSPDRAGILLIEWASWLLEVKSNLDLVPRKWIG